MTLGQMSERRAPAPGFRCRGSSAILAATVGLAGIAGLSSALLPPISGPGSAPSATVFLFGLVLAATGGILIATSRLNRKRREHGIGIIVSVLAAACLCGPALAFVAAHAFVFGAGGFTFSLSLVFRDAGAAGETLLIALISAGWVLMAATILWLGGLAVVYGFMLTSGEY